jgi:hypothetical protein
MGFAMLCLVLTGLVVRAGLLPRWWLLIPAVFFVAALVRFHAVPSYPVVF